MCRRLAPGILALGVTMAMAGWSATAADGPPVIVALALDTSGSVGEPDLARTRELALGILGSLPPGSEVAVLTFDDQSRVVQPRTSQPDEVRKALSQARIAGRYTALYDALYDASRYLHDLPAARKAIVLVTDGKDENSSLNLEDGLRVAEENGIPVFAVGVGHVEERILRRIAKLTGGDYLLATEAQGPALAGRILERPLPSTAPSAVPLSSPPTSASVPASTPPPARATPAEPRHSAVLLWAALVGGLVVAALLAWLALGRPRPAPRCPRCGRVLGTPFSECPFCAAEDRLSGSPEESPLLESSLSETVVAQLSSTEEYLEKTITLQEKPILLVTAGASLGQVFNLSLESVTSIGRSKANDIILEDVAISSQHCRIRPENGLFVVHDLRSTNGTFLNERKITRAQLNSGDTLKVGETSLQFRMDQKRGFGPS